MKIFCSLILGLMLLMNSAEAVDKEYLNGDKNYIYCGASMGAGFFVDRNSLSVEKYNPPQYIISIDVVEVGNYFNNGSTKISRRKNCKFMYNYSTRKVYIYTPDVISRQDMRKRYETQVQKIDQSIDWNSDWVILDVYYGEGTGHYKDAAEVAFALAYKLKFSNSNFYENYYRLIGGVKDSL